MTQRTNILIKLLLLLLPLLSMSGCDSNLKDLRKFSEQAKTLPLTQTLPAPNIIIPKPYSYQAYTYNDPFANLQQQQATDMSGPLTHYPLYALKLVGTIARGNTMWAAILAPDGKVYVAQLNDYIGINKARVVKIEPGQVTTAQQDDNTGAATQTSTLSLQNMD